MARKKPRITPQSAKARGRKYQQQIAQQISKVTNVPVKKDGDIESRPMGQSGSDIIIRGRAKELFPFGVECKNRERLDIWSSLKQSEEYGDSLLFFKRNYSPSYVAMRADTFFALYSEVLAGRRDKEQIEHDKTAKA